jgi:hypothetical protein
MSVSMPVSMFRVCAHVHGHGHGHEIIMNMNLTVNAKHDVEN